MDDAVGEAVALVSGEEQPLLRDIQRTTVHVVTTPEEMPVTETVELVKSLVHGQTRRLARYRCENCGFKARQFYWRCPACGGWETNPPRRSAR